MNVFGTFTFGRLIKTFLPGTVLFASALLYLDAVANLFGLDFSVINWAIGNPILTTLATIPGSIILGILLNTVVFGGLLDVLVRQPVNSEMSEFNVLRDSIVDCTLNTSETNTLIPSDIYDTFKEHVDFDSFMLPRVDLDKLVYIRESYWYYLEFQVNVALASVFSLTGVFFWWIRHDTVVGLTAGPALVLAAALILVTGLVFVALIRAARLNYMRHKKKLLSLWIGQMAAGTPTD